MKNKLILIAATLAAAGNAAGDPGKDTSEADVVIYGGTSAAVAAAVQVRRMGKSVIVVCPDQHLGGLSSGGLGMTDSGDKTAIGGISREFYQRVKTYYDDPATWQWQQPGQFGRYRPGDDAQWTFEPHIAERVFEDLVREYEIPVHRDEWLNREPGKGVTKQAGRMTSVTMLSGRTCHAKMFIDATYEGDLMAAAGVSHTVGREPNSKYGETLNGVQKGARTHQFTHNISPYQVPGDPSSGLLPRVHADDPGNNGQGDHRVQAYNFRMCLTRVPENRIPFPKPEGYDASQYELLLRTLLAGSRHITGKFDMLPNLKTDTNNSGPFSTDNIGMNYDYPEASYARRREIIREHQTYQMGHCWFLANDPRVPEDVRKWYGQWGLAKDEFADNGHWPYQIYVREARRMVADFVVTENHLRRRQPTPRPVGMGSYNMDSHHVQRYVDEQGFVRNEGDVQVNPGGPYPIDYGTLVPQQAECENLLVVCAVSSTHIAYGSIRMEPVFMILGQSAATAAVLALEQACAVQQVPYPDLRQRLLADGQLLRAPQPAADGKPNDL
ncbi:MAG: FAD-dependent oxidoreductase [Verrucomicrobia bacterium]|nr:FAD-dependent oxidoreductase [Verrucomicrobiota bacterium]